MARMHDNGRGVEPPDLRELVDRAGAVSAAMQALLACVEAIEADVDGLDARALLVALRVSGDVRDAGYYLGRALRDLRTLL